MKKESYILIGSYWGDLEFSLVTLYDKKEYKSQGDAPWSKELVETDYTGLILYKKRFTVGELSFSLPILQEFLVNDRALRFHSRKVSPVGLRNYMRFFKGGRITRKKLRASDLD